MNITEQIIDICKEKHIPISRLERDCGFSNGYLNGKQKGKDFPFSRLIVICEYLNVPIWQFSDELKQDIVKYLSGTII